MANQDDAILVQIDDSEDFCYICRSDRNPHQLMICDLCDFMVAHTYCCGFDDFPEDWMCRDCLLLEVSDSSDDLEVDESSASEDFRPLTRNQMNQINNQQANVIRERVVNTNNNNNNNRRSRRHYQADDERSNRAATTANTNRVQ